MLQVQSHRCSRLRLLLPSSRPHDSVLKDNAGWWVAVTAWIHPFLQACRSAGFGMVPVAKAGIRAVAQVDNVCRWTKTPLYFGLRHTALNESQLAGIDSAASRCVRCDVGGL